MNTTTAAKGNRSTTSEVCISNTTFSTKGQIVKNNHRPQPQFKSWQ